MIPKELLEDHRRKSAQNLVLDILYCFRYRPIDPSAIVRINRLFGFSEPATRMAVSRLKQSGILEQDGRGRYYVGTSGRFLADIFQDWPSQLTKIVPWQGGWIIALVDSGLKEPVRRARRNRALVLRGFQALREEILVRPNNWRGGLDSLRQDMESFGVAHDVTLCAAQEFDQSSENALLHLWDKPEQESRYLAAIKLLESSEKMFPDLETGDVVLESLKVGGALTRQILLDPLLPDQMINADLRRKVIQKFADYANLAVPHWMALAGLDPNETGDMRYHFQE